MKPRGQGTLTVVAPIRPECHAELVERLELLGWSAYRQATDENMEEEDDGAGLWFRRMGGLHFARLCIVEPFRETSLMGLAPQRELLLSTQFDGNADEHLRELVEHGAKGLLEVLRCCAGFDGEDGPEEARIQSYLRRHLVRAGAFYVGAPLRTVARIRRERTEADTIRNVAARIDLDDVEPTEAWHRIRRAVEEEDDVKIVPHGDVVDWTRHKRRKKWLWRGIVLLVLLAPPLLVIFSQPWGTLAVLFLVFAVIWLRHLEQLDAARLERDESSMGEARRRKILEDWNAKLEATEDLWPQNQLTIVSEIKPDLTRRLLVPVILWLIKFRARHKFTLGLLHGLRTIHFAHWSRFDRGRRLLFVSNYDGNWSGYLDDFVANAPGALSAIWSNCVGFPRTRLLRWEGAEDGRRFKAWARLDQVPPSVWYSAYPNLTCESIERNTQLVEGLMRDDLGLPRFREEAAAWLRWL